MSSVNRDQRGLAADPGSTVLHDWEALVEHFGGEEVLRSRVMEACDYDYPDVEFDDFGNGPSIVLHTPDTEWSLSETIAFPISATEFWSRIDDLNLRLNEAVDVLTLPTVIRDDEEAYVATLVEALEERLSATKEQILASIGGGWVSCDDLIEDQHRGTKSWFKIGDPVLAAIGVGRQETTIVDVEWVPAGTGGPERLDWLESMDFDTEELLGGYDDEGSVYLNEVIAKARRRLRLCRGCRQVHRYVWNYDTTEGSVKSLCERCAAVYLDRYVLD